jgi:hypothetical protein
MISIVEDCAVPHRIEPSSKRAINAKKVYCHAQLDTINYGTESIPLS